jgi:hypothetical protein
MNSSHPIPENLMELPIHEVRTWQFFERDCVIQSGQSDGRARRFVVSSKSTGKAKANPRSHFGISMFGKKALSGSESAEDGFYRLKRLEGQIQPLLDWLAVNHHDFMRLNDFSEAFSLLRWLASKQTELTVIDMDGQGEAIVTPDRVERGMGPHIGSQSDISAITDRGRKGD